ncbi:replication protein A 32 kDa subunit A isoform X2 [Impatiens glandulifera]|uniref:replication protein A 32 kDa subunit A isoform X2 n=1 Tax=Impatiens glandulifera TaxID=253017 RepID=UPI001FB126BF|nr:replication protein A 32 kDa subunit A isoform X2 [Impatiens glandulifera]
MYGNQFDGNAAFSGGGFMPSQSTQTADHSFSPAKNRDTQSLLPLTIKQINDAFLSSDDKSNFLIDGVVVSNVKLVGLVFNKAERITDVSFVIDDGTGRIDCNRWVNEPVDTKEMENILDGMYVSIHGHLKGFQGKRQLVVFSIRPIVDFNAIAYHFIECIYVHSYNIKVQQQQGGGASSSFNMQNPAISTPSMGGYQAAPSNQYGGGGGGGYSNGLKGIDKMVIDYLQQPSCLGREKGVHVNEIGQQLNMTVDNIRQSIKCLEEEGLVYSTIDDFHFKSTGNG